MKTIIHHAKDRGSGEYGWLSTRYSFSFANWYNPTRMGFGALRAINDDTIAPDSGFGEHSHADMEIITLVTSGTLTHKDSMGNVGTVGAGEVQVMSAGTGVSHAEFNASPHEPLTLFQIWILPNEERVTPRYEQKEFDADEGFTELVRPLARGGEGLGIHQDAWITRARMSGGSELTYMLKNPEHGVYAFVISGTPVVADVPLTDRDALGITETETISLTAESAADILLIEVPLSQAR